MQFALNNEMNERKGTKVKRKYLEEKHLIISFKIKIENNKKKQVSKKKKNERKGRMNFLSQRNTIFLMRYTCSVLRLVN